MAVFARSVRLLALLVTSTASAGVTPAIAAAGAPAVALESLAPAMPAATFDALAAFGSPAPLAALGGQRERVVGDVYHQALTLPLGSGPNAAIRLHRLVREGAGGRPRPTSGGVLLMHGDFSSFASNFAPRLLDPDAAPAGLGIWLAERGFDVWGVDRRWALTPAVGDLSDYGDISFEQELQDVAIALAAARFVRAFSGGGHDGLTLIGFSRGGFLAYAAAARDAALPAWARQVRGLVPLDIWAQIPPEDTAARAFTCESAALERELLDQGITDSENSFFIVLGELAEAAPDEPSPLLDGFSNRELFLLTAGQTYEFFSPTERYHLAAPRLEGGVATGLTESSEAMIARWFAHATPHQSLRESADTDSIWCGDGSSPPAPDLSRIEVPLLYVGAAGGYGEHGIHSTTRVGSSDVTSLIIARQPPDQVAADFGHGDLLFAADAPTLVWEPLAEWLLSH